MWRFVAPAFEQTHRVVLFDHVGAGGSDLAAYDPTRLRARLDGYAQDVVEILEALDLGPVVFVGHSVSAMIGLLASVGRGPTCFDRLVLVGPSPALHRRRRLPRRVHGRRDRRAAGDDGRQLPRLVRVHRAGDHGQPGTARSWARS